MLSTIKSWFASTDEPEQVSIEEAVTILAMEILLADFQFAKQEMAQLLALLAKRFGEDEHQLLEIIERSKQLPRDAQSIERFAQVVNQQFDENQKQQLITDLWLVAKSDDEIDGLEQQKIIEVANLLHLPEKAVAQGFKASGIDEGH